MTFTDELMKPKELSRIDEPEYSQTLCTAVQIALVDLLESFSIRPSVVVGHSSGEIAAA
jgi:acyl transferase domain-containing protein